MALGLQINWLPHFLMKFLGAINFQNFPFKCICPYCHHLKGQPGAGVGAQVLMVEFCVNSWAHTSVLFSFHFSK